MKPRTRSLHRPSPSRTKPFFKFLKPGALAQLRNSRISARSHQVVSLPPISPRLVSSPFSPSSNGDQPLVNTIDGFPCFSAKIFGPRCPQRKKLVAAKFVLFLNSRLSIPVSNSPDVIISVLNNENGAVVAH